MVQKMEGKLARWALAIQEYDVTIKYRKGNQNNNADALSRRPVGAVLELQCGFSNDDIRQHQQDDPNIGQILQYLHQHPLPRLNSMLLVSSAGYRFGLNSLLSMESCTGNLSLLAKKNLICYLLSPKLFVHTIFSSVTIFHVLDTNVL